MASKQFPLQILLGAVDGVSGVLTTVGNRIDALTAPLRRVRENLGNVEKASRLKKVGEAWDNVGDKAKGVKDAFAPITKTFLAAGAAAGLVAHEVLQLVGEQDQVGKLADRIGFTANSFGNLRGAAKLASQDAAGFDASLETFSKTMGLTRSGLGKLAGLLGKVSPALLKQLKATKSNEEAFYLFADAIETVKDPAKQAVLATAAFGDPKIITFLKDGAAGVRGQVTAYTDLAGQQGDSIATAQKVAEVMDTVEAALDGVKAALVVGLGPAFADIGKRISSFVAGNRPQITKFLSDVGAKIPGAVAEMIRVGGELAHVVGAIVSAFGGLENVAKVVAAIFVGKLVFAVASFGKALVSLGAAAALNPVILILGAIAGLAFLVINNWESVKAWFVEFGTATAAAFSALWSDVSAAGSAVVDGLIAAWNGFKSFFAAIWEGIATIFNYWWAPIQKALDFGAKAIQKIGGWFGGGTSPTPASTTTGAGSVQLQASRQTNDARVTVDFANMPAGARATADPRSTAAVGLNVGYQLGY